MRRATNGVGSPGASARAWSRALAVLTPLVAVLAVPTVASAHGLPGPPPLPIPEWLFYWAAALVLVASFVALAVAWPRPRLVAVAEGRLVVLPRLPRRLLGDAVSALGLVLYALVVWAGLTGTSDVLSNLAPTTIYVVFWVAIPAASLLVGDLWALLSPWRTIARLAAAGARLVGGAGGTPEPLAYPAWLGRWPAAVAVLVFGWFELVAGDGQDPSVLAIVALVYAAIMLGGCSVWGLAFLDRADGFGTYFGWAASLSPLRWTDRGVRLRAPGSGVADLDAGPGTLAAVCVLLGTTTFDGLSGTGLWGDDGGLSSRLTDAASGLGFSPGTSFTVADTAGLLLGSAFVFAVLLLAAWGMRRVTRHPDDEPLSVLAVARRFAPTLVPVAVGYAMAHYLSELLTQGQGIAPLLSDPRGTGANLLGTAGWEPDYTWLSGQFYWYAQIVALLGGHVIGLVAAHDLALRTFTRARAAVRSQYWMLAAMVALTCIGLWLVSQ